MLILERRCSNGMKKIKGRFLAAFLSATVLLSVSATPLTVSAGEKNGGISSAVSSSFNKNPYYEYSAEFTSAQRPLIKNSALLSQFKDFDLADIEYGTYEGRENTLIWDSGKGYIELEVNIEKTGLYELQIDYFPIYNESVANPEFELYIDGKLPFSECAQLCVTRVYRDESYISSQDNAFETDNRGNEVCPEPTEISGWRSFSFRDDTGENADPYAFYLTEGVHTVRLVSLRDPIAISGLHFTNMQDPCNYDEYKQNAKGEETENVLIEIEAEKPVAKTSATIYPASNKSSTATTPLDPYATRLNTIGGTNWHNPIQTVTWEFEVPKDGCYKIGMRFRQNYIRGLYTARSVKIDDELLFSELENIRFDYSSSWQLKILGDDAPFSVYLEKGRHTISMTPTVTELSDDISKVNAVVNVLDEVYNSIIMVTGTDPDMYRDYYLDESIPDMMDKMKSAAKDLQDVSDKIQKIVGNKGGMSATLDRVVDQLKSFIKKPDTIPVRISNFQSNISALASWVLELRSQSLMLDKLYIVGAKDEFPEIRASFVDAVTYHIKSFLYSFAGDYTSIGNTYDKKEAVYIWLNGSRDIAGVLKTLIDSDFTTQTGIKVNANLTTTSLLAAVMADKGPDVAISVARGEPVNLALRGAVVPLNELEGFDEVTKDFSKTALTPYIYNGNCYALPVTQSFLMMFYREDIFASLEMEPPKTWKELYAVSEVLQRNNMNIGIPIDLFYTLLFQMGGSLYNDDLTATALETTTAYNAFKMWCDLYTQYGLPLYKDDYNRFRTGELPLVIADYLFYNQLYATAPEIRNMWSMVEIPGIEDQNGNINNTSNALGTACVLLSNAKNQENAWKFIKWWVSGKTQGTYATRVESTLGVIARAAPASYTAMKKIAWSNSEASVLFSQWEKTRETEEIPGSYYTTRNISNAFNEVYYDESNPRQTLIKWNEEINSELIRKRNEFENAE